MSLGAVGLGLEIAFPASLIPMLIALACISLAERGRDIQSILEAERIAGAA